MKTPKEVQGQSFARLLDDPEAAEGRADALIQVGKNFCLRTKKWAYIRYAAGKKDGKATMLYDMEKDPKQFTNLAGKAEYVEIQKTLDERLNERIALARKGK